MIPSLEGWPTKAKEAPSPQKVRLTWKKCSYRKTYNFNKNETQAHLFSCELYEVFKNTNFVENLQKAASARKSGL